MEPLITWTKRLCAGTIVAAAMPVSLLHADTTDLWFNACSTKYTTSQELYQNFESAGLKPIGKEDLIDVSKLLIDEAISRSISVTRLTDGIVMPEEFSKKVQLTKLMTPQILARSINGRDPSRDYIDYEFFVGADLIISIYSAFPDDFSCNVVFMDNAPDWILNRVPADQSEMTSLSGKTTFLSNMSLIEFQNTSISWRPVDVNEFRKQMAREPFVKHTMTMFHKH